MALARWERDIVDDAGNLLAGSFTVEVRRESDNGLASIYEDREGEDALGNSFSATNPLAFHVAGGAYKITITQGAFSRVWRYVAIGTGAETDNAATGASTTDVLTGTDSQKSTTPNAIAALWEKGADVASASTISLGEGGLFHVTGTTGISDIDFATPKDGRQADLIFDGVLTLTHSSNLVLPGAANIVTAAGDRMGIRQDNSDKVVALWYQRASGLPLGGAATETTQGVVELATTSEAATGTDTARAVTPAGLRAGSTWKKIAEASPSSVAAVDFTNLSAYRHLRLSGFLKPATDGAELCMRFSTDNGANFEAGANAYNWLFDFGGDSHFDTADSFGVLCEDVGNGTNEGVGFDANVHEFNKSGYAYFNAVGSTVGNQPTGFTSGGIEVVAGARNALRLLFSSGNISTGHLILEGFEG